MATFHFAAYATIGSTFLRGGQTGCLMHATTTASIYSVFGNNTAGTSYLEIYQGEVPTFPSFTDASTRAADLLIRFPLTATTTTTQLVGNQWRQQVGRHLVDTAATGSGIATWFLARKANTTSLTTSGGVIGTVGITGGGADLEVPNTAIVLGQNYQCAGFTLSWPISQTV